MSPLTLAATALLKHVEGIAHRSVKRTRSVQKVETTTTKNKLFMWNQEKDSFPLKFEIPCFDQERGIPERSLTNSEFIHKLWVSSSRMAENNELDQFWAPSSRVESENEHDKKPLSM